MTWGIRSAVGSLGPLGRRMVLIPLIHPPSLVTRPGFSFKEPRRAASAGLVRKVKIYHSSIDLLVLDGFGGARWRNNSIPQ